MAKNMTPEELEHYINKPRKSGIKWREVLEESFFPEDLLVKYLNKMFSPNAYWQDRAKQVIAMYKRHNHMISAETFETLCTHYGSFAGEDNMSDIFDFVAYNDSFSTKEFNAYYNNHHGRAWWIIEYVKHNPKALSASMVERVYEVRQMPNWKKATLENMSEEVKDVLRKYNPIKNVENGYQQRLFFHIYSIEEVLNTFEKVYTMIDALYGSCNDDRMYSSEELFKLIKNDPIALDVFIEKILSSDESDIRRSRSVKRVVKSVLEGHERFDEVMEHCTPIRERIAKLDAADIDWHQVDNDLQNMAFNEREAWFARTDVPVWFLNKNAGVLLHIQQLQMNNDMKLFGYGQQVLHDFAAHGGFIGAHNCFFGN